MSITSHPTSTMSHAPGADAELPGRNEKRIRAQGTRQSAMRSNVRIRGFTFDVDEPEPVGGTDTAPTPMEYMVGALNACLGVVIEKVAGEIRLAVEEIETYCLATQDTRGFEGTADVRPYFHSCRIAVHVQTSEPDAEQWERLTTSVESRCPALTLVRAAGVDVDLRWRFAERIEAGAAERDCNEADAVSRGLPARIPLVVEK